MKIPFHTRNVLRILRSVLVVSILMAVLSSYSGSYLATYKKKLENTPGLAALLPVMMAAIGAAASAYGSRLSTDLHLGRPSVTRALRDASAQFLALITVLGAYAEVISLVFASGKPGLVVLVLKTTSCAYAVATGLATASVVGAVKAGVNPDDVVGPLVTTVTDAVTIILSMFFAP